MAHRILNLFWLSAVLTLQMVWSAGAWAETYSFGVVPVRSAVLSAQYWNPILDYVAQKAGITLQLQFARTPTLTAAALEAGEYDFAYSYLIFRPKALRQKYRVILQPVSGKIRSQIVSLPNAPVNTLSGLAGLEVGFPSKSGFVAYGLPMDHLLKKEIIVKPVFGGNHEGVIGQLRNGQVVAVSVSSQVMQAYAERENLKYNVLWESSPYNDLPIAAHPKVPNQVVQKVQAAFASMNDDPAGKEILESVSKIINLKPPYGFKKADVNDYMEFANFYQNTLVKDLE